MTVERSGRSATHLLGPDVPGRQGRDDRALRAQHRLRGRSPTGHRRCADASPPDGGRGAGDRRAAPRRCSSSSRRGRCSARRRSRGGDEAVTGGWLRARGEAPPEPGADRPLRRRLVAGAVQRPRRLRRARPTLELTIHFRARPEPEDALRAGPLPLRGLDRRPLRREGEIWSRDGRLLAQSRQLALAAARVPGRRRARSSAWPRSSALGKPPCRYPTEPNPNRPQNDQRRRVRPGPDAAASLTTRGREAAGVG